jgi:hypothetical protein
MTDSSSPSSAPSNLGSSLVGALWVWVALAAWPLARDALTSVGLIRQRADVSSMRMFEVPSLDLALSVFTLQDVLAFGVILSLGFHLLASLGPRVLASSPAHDAGFGFLACAPIIVYTPIAEALRGIVVGLDAAPSAALALALLFFLSPSRAITPSRGMLVRGALAALVPSACIAYALNVGPAVADSGDRHAALAAAFGTPYTITTDMLAASAPLGAFFGEDLTFSPPTAPGDTLWLDRFSDRAVLKGGVLVRGARAEGACLVHDSIDAALPTLSEGGSFMCASVEGAFTLSLDHLGALELGTTTSPDRFPSFEPLAPEPYAALPGVLARADLPGLNTSGFPSKDVTDSSLTLTSLGEENVSLRYTFSFTHEGKLRTCHATASTPGHGGRKDGVVCLGEGDVR